MPRRFSLSKFADLTCCVVWTMGLVVAWVSIGKAQAGAPTGGATALVHVTIEPSQTQLVGQRAWARLIATGHYADGSLRDLTREVTWSTADPAVVTASSDGQLMPRGDGTAEVIATIGSTEARACVNVSDARQALPVQFEHDVLPILSKAGCNQGSCHGTPTGKNGFRLSLRGYDAKLDYMTLAREVGTRRTNRLDPEASLILLKGLGVVEHTGGQRFQPSSFMYKTLRDWVAEGLQPQPTGSPALVRVEVTPSQRVLDQPAQEQQLVVRAVFADGSSRDVTRVARYSTSDERVAQADEAGRVRRVGRGEAAILVSFESKIATSRLIFLEPVPGLVWTDPPENNFVDTHVFAKLKLLRVPPSDLADDAMFLRRVYLDTMGLVPTPDELRQFLADTQPDKRSTLIDALLERPEYVDFWALKWADRLGCNRRFVGYKGVYAYHRWIRDQVAANVPLDKFARSIVTAKGGSYTYPPSSFYRRIRNPADTVETVSQVFLGVRLQCAKCHNHVSERWTQDDFYGMAAFFSQVRYKNTPQKFDNDNNGNKEETIYVAPSAEVIHPRTGETMRPKPLGSPVAEVASGDDRREALADWLVSPGNPFFAKAAVNRIWFHLFGRGIVDPVDDIRDSNPPASAELLQALADDFVAHGFDTKRTIRLILNSRTYQLSSRPNAWNDFDTRYFSHMTVRLLSAEQLLDAISRITGVPEVLSTLPPGTRAAQIPDGEMPNTFLRTFGQPLRTLACECERGSDSTLEQALQIVGGRTIHNKIIAPNNRIGTLLSSGVDDRTLVDELFLAALGRAPEAAERDIVVSRLAAHADDRRRVVEDLLWSFFNHPEFLFQH